MKEYIKGFAICSSIVAGIFFIGPVIFGAGIWWITFVFKFLGL